MYLGSNRCCVLPLNKFIIGAQGPTGHAGPIGTLGSTGHHGNKGPQGDSGLCYRGYKGTKGSVGPQGGLTGNTGPIGPVGPTEPVFDHRSRYFSFTLGNCVYSNTYIDLIQYANPVVDPLDYNILLDNKNYTISWEINSSWADINNKFYISFLKPDLTPVVPHVFLNTHPNVLYSHNDKLYSIGNDILDLSAEISANLYTIQLNIANEYTSGIDVSGKSVEFSITFVPINS